MKNRASNVSSSFVYVFQAKFKSCLWLCHARDGRKPSKVAPFTFALIVWIDLFTTAYLRFISQIQFNSRFSYHIRKNEAKMKSKTFVWWDDMRKMINFVGKVLDYFIFLFTCLCIYIFHRLSLDKEILFDEDLPTKHRCITKSENNKYPHSIPSIPQKSILLISLFQFAFIWSTKTIGQRTIDARIRISSGIGIVFPWFASPLFFACCFVWFTFGVLFWKQFDCCFDLCAISQNHLSFRWIVLI